MLAMDKHLVTVICVCFNHQQFLEEALNSVFKQTYPYIQLIVVDDCSQDGSAQKLSALHGERPFELLLLSENNGYCKAFNQGLALAKGELIIDLAGDDRLMPDRVALGVKSYYPVPMACNSETRDISIARVKL
jgi:glycosyltransferase involved in cell wall biosynthesis